MVRDHRRLWHALQGANPRDRSTQRGRRLLSSTLGYWLQSFQDMSWWRLVSLILDPPLKG